MNAEKILKKLVQIYLEQEGAKAEIIVERK